MARDCEICECPDADVLVTEGGIAVCRGCREDAAEKAEQDHEEAMDEVLAQQELEDFEQTDEYFGCFDGGDW